MHHHYGAYVVYIRHAGICQSSLLQSYFVCVVSKYDLQTRGYKFIRWERLYAQLILCSLPPALWQERGVLGVEKTGDSLIILCSRSSQGVGGLGFGGFSKQFLARLGGPQGLGKAGGGWWGLDRNLSRKSNEANLGRSHVSGKSNEATRWHHSLGGRQACLG